MFQFSLKLYTKLLQSFIFVEKVDGVTRNFFSFGSCLNVTCYLIHIFIINILKLFLFQIH